MQAVLILRFDSDMHRFQLFQFNSAYFNLSIQFKFQVIQYIGCE